MSEGARLGNDEDYVAWLRRLAREGVTERGDVGDFSPFDFVTKFYNTNPECRDRIDDAYATLIFAEDPLPRLVLEQATSLVGHSFLPRLYREIEGRCAELAARVDTSRTDGRSLLGSVVATVAMLSKDARPSLALAHELASFDRPEDGWPTNLPIALAADVDGLFSKFEGVLRRVDDEQLHDVARAMISDGSPLTDVVFDKIRQGDPEIRDRVGRAVRRCTDHMETTRGELASLVLDDPELQARVRAAAAKPNPWPVLAQRLGVPEAE